MSAVLTAPTEGKVEQFKLDKDKGNFKVWRVRVRNDKGYIDATLAGNREPKPGDEVNVEASEYGPKAKFKGKGGFGGGGRRSSPEERASIESQVAAKAVVELVVADKATEQERQALNQWILGRLG